MTYVQLSPPTQVYLSTVSDMYVDNLFGTGSDNSSYTTFYELAEKVNEERTQEEEETKQTILKPRDPHLSGGHTRSETTDENLAFGE